MKYLSLTRTGSAGKLHARMSKTYPGAKSVCFYYLMSDEKENAAFDSLYAALDKKPEIVLCFQYYDDGKPPERYREFIKRASKTSKLFYYLHDTPREINYEYLEQFDRVFVANFESAKRFQAQGLPAEFLPMGCFEEVHISIMPFREDIQLIPAVCFYTQWLSHKWGGLNREKCIEKLVAENIPVAFYGPKKLWETIPEFLADKPSLKYHGIISPCNLHTLPPFKVVFNGISRAGELALNVRFCEVLGMGAVQLYPECPYFVDFCEAFFGERPSPEESPFVLFDGYDDLVEKTGQILREPDIQTIKRRKKASIYREKWTLTKMARVLVNDEENPAKAIGSQV